MTNKRLPYALNALALCVMLLYPRLVPAGSPEFLRNDGFVGFVYGICLGLQILGLMMMRRMRCQRAE